MWYMSKFSLLEPVNESCQQGLWKYIQMSKPAQIASKIFLLQLQFVGVLWGLHEMVHVIAAAHSFPYGSSMCIQGDMHWLHPHAQNVMPWAQRNEDLRRRKNAAFDDTFDLFSSMESRRDKDGKGNQSLQWWKQGGKKANAWGVINKGRW